ncbi:MAG: tRNA preQ1(34) S-adenosylmethionine ribosyltransferase-isomerase QueA [Candidatus Sulfotelmatobacter sp.]
MLVSDFNFHLPEDLIAQAPLADRSASRLLHVERSTGQLSDRGFRDFPGLLRPDDLLVLNNTKVFPARLLGRRAGLNSQAVSARNPAAREFLQGRVEVLLTRQVGPSPGTDKSEGQNDWECLVRPGRKIQVGERIFFGDDDEGQHELQAEVLARGPFGERTIRFEPVDDFFAKIALVGHVPLPPYIDRPDSSADRARYQTVYARERGSVAAPTAGLHFTPEVLSQIADRGIETAEITLHVGLGTFQPVRVERVEEHKLHREPFTITPAAANKINGALAASRRVIAVGTTTVRTLEYAARQAGGSISAGSGDADIFIYPGYKFQVVQGLLTNFHLPESTLLMLVCAFGGRENVLRAYDHAVEQRYRFYSYGDCMFLA